MNTLHTLRPRLLDFFARPWDSPHEDADFDALARDIFAFQFEHNGAYGEYCRRRGVLPTTLAHWTEIPAVPTAAFKVLTLVAGRAEDAQAVFYTSGTTKGEQRGAHAVLDLSIYHASLLPAFQAMVLPDDARPILASLMPPSAEMPDSSLAHMIGIVMQRVGAPGSGYFASVEHGIDVVALDTLLAHCIDENKSVCLLGTSFSFVHWLDALDANNMRYSLPSGSRVMDTGGFKGRSRTVPDGELRASYAAKLGIDESHCVNEYGMTEMCSQFYDATLRDHVRGRSGERRKCGPAWVRTRVVDPETLAPMPQGRTGLLQHIDLANVGSVLAIQTQDLGVAVGDGFRVLGRAAGARPRGCSIAMDALLEAAERYTP